MFVQSLKLQNFRNYESLDLQLGQGRNIFIGENAQGKTNILEAIYLCTCARSHRTGRDHELIRRAAAGYRIELNFSQDGQNSEKIEILYQEENKADKFPRIREIYYQNNKLEKISELFGLFHAVIFAPEDVMLVKEGPAARRRFLDLLLSQVKPSYFASLQLYQHILQQRNSLLKQFREQGTLAKDAEIYLAAFDEQLAQAATKLISNRAIALARLEELAAAALATISDGKEVLKIHYRGPAGLNSETVQAEDQIESYLNQLTRHLHEDILKGNSSYGPHRDDLDLALNDILIKPYASQGQQRSVVLALKLAELLYLEEESGERPVLLLDDVMSELDQKRRYKLQEAICGHQVLLTCTDRDQVEGDEIEAASGQSQAAASFFQVHEASVRRCPTSP